MKMPTQRVRKHIDRATKLLAAGKTIIEVAHEMGFTSTNVQYWRREYPEFWEQQLNAAGGIPPQPGEVKRPMRPPITAKVRTRIIEATRLFARGLSLTEVAATLKVRPTRLTEYRTVHRDVWQMAQEEADAFVVDLVRSMAGTDAMLDDPDRYLAMANRAESWCNDHGEKLFKANGKMTLEDFYHKWYVKECMAPDASAAYKDQFERALRRWKLVTGNPPLNKITNDLLRRYRDFCMQARGQTPGTKAAPATVRNKLIYVQRLLRKAGPSGWKNFDAAECIPRVPWVRLPREPRRVPKIVSEEQISAVYRAAGMMTVPQIAGVEPADWWRALFVTTWNTGLRRRTLFALRWEWMKPVNEQRFVIPPEAMKSARGQIVHLPSIVIAHLNVIRTRRELVFPWPYDLTHFSTLMHRLQYDAGIPRADHFGLQTIRRTLATRLWSQNPKAAQLALGHTMDTTTREHYVAGPGIVSAALNAMPQPEAFGGDGHTEENAA